MPELAEWDSFYVIIGSSAGALIGLQFVVITLVADRPQLRGEEIQATNDAFATPTIVHFGATLLLSALLRVPWPSVSIAACFWSLSGVAGLVYLIVVAKRMCRQTAYRPQFEDWCFHIVMPAGAYLLLTASACGSLWNVRTAAFGMAGSALLLLFTGIHNVWDAVVYTAISKAKAGD